MLAISLVRDIYGVASRPGDIGNDASLVIENRVDKGGFSHVGTTYDRNLDRILFTFALLWFEACGDRSEALRDCRLKFVEISPMGCRDAPLMIKAQLAEFGGIGICLCRVHLVRKEDHIPFFLSKESGEFAIDRVDSFPGIDNEQDKVRSMDRDIGLGPNLVGKTIIEEGADSSGVREFIGHLGFGDLSCNPVAGDSWLVVNDGNPSTREAVEDRRFTHVRTSDDGDLGEGATRHQIQDGYDQTRAIGGCPLSHTGILKAR